LLHLAPIRAYVVVSIEQIQLTELQLLGESRSSNLDFRFAHKQGFRRIGLDGENHLDHTLLCFALGQDPRLAIDFKHATAASMPHQFLNDLHVLSVANKKRRECMTYATQFSC